MDLLVEIRDDDLKQKAAGLEGSPGYAFLLERLAATQRERDRELRKTPVQRRMTRIQRELKETAFEQDDRHHIHSVLALCGLPYREPPAEAREYFREYGKNSLVVQAGYLKNPETVDRRQQMTPLQLGSSTRKSVGVEPDPAPQISAITGPNEPNTSRKAGSVLDADWGSTLRAV